MLNSNAPNFEHGKFCQLDFQSLAMVCRWAHHWTHGSTSPGHVESNIWNQFFLPSRLRRSHSESA